MEGTATTSVRVKAPKSQGLGQRVSVSSASGTACGRDKLNIQRERLRSELAERFGQLAGLEWCKEGVRHAAAIALGDLLKLGNQIINEADGERPHRLNITPAGTGQIGFTLFGAEGRELELWVGREDGRFTWLASWGGDNEADGTTAIASYGPFASWLSGNGPLP